MPALEDDADRLVSEYCDLCGELFADCECEEPCEHCHRDDCICGLGPEV